MKNLKRAVALIVTVAMVMSLGLVNVFAVDPDMVMFTVNAEKTRLAPGESMTVSIISDTTYELGAFSAVEYSFDTTAFTVEQQSVAEG
ncbi:MAG TPA: hypothetical protein H9900_03130, partial [Candidatus Monoglobus merdigallinarum]|nr:hypothetical protein [Candidatus Monoglobus merdigallinarum]